MPIAIKPRVLVVGAANADEDMAELRRLAEVVQLPMGDVGEEAALLRAASTQYGEFVGFCFTIQADAKTPPTFSKEALRHLKNLKIMAGAGAGYDKIDVGFLSSVGTMYANAPSVIGQSTADGALMLLLSALRGLTPQNDAAHAGQWRASNCPTRNWRKATIGIIGMGTIGVRVADMCEALGMTVVYSTRRPRPELRWRHVSFDELLTSADAIILACPLTADTRHLLDREAFRRMKRGMVVVNVARGPVIDDDALVEALENGSVLRAALDVFADEPNIDPRLRANPNVTLSPHLAGAIDSVASDMNAEAIQNLVAYLRTGVPNTPVNLNELRSHGYSV